MKERHCRYQKYFAPISKDKRAIILIHLCSQHNCATTHKLHREQPSVIPSGLTLLLKYK